MSLGRVPQEVVNLFEGLTGMKWPMMDPDKMYELAGVYQDTSKKIMTDLPELFNKGVVTLTETFHMSATDPFVKSMSQFTSGDPNYLAQLALAASQIGDFVTKTAADAEYTKMMIIAQLIELLAEIAFAIFMAELGFFEWLFNLTIEYIITREFILTLLKWLFRTIAQHVIIGVVTGVAMDRIIQRIQINEHHRDGFDNKLLLQAVEYGVIGGVLAGPIGALGAGLGKGIGNLVGKNVTKLLSDAIGKTLSGSFGKGLSDAVTKSLANDLAKAFTKDIRGLLKGFADSGARLAGNVAQAFEKHLGDVLGADAAREFGRSYAEALAANWTKDGLETSLRDVVREFADAIGGDAGALLRAEADKLAKEMPEAIRKVLKESPEGSLRYRAGGQVGAVAGDWAHGSFSEGFYNLIFDPSHSFHMTWTSGAASAAMSRAHHVGQWGALTLADKYFPNRPTIPQLLDNYLGIRPRGADAAPPPPTGAPPPESSSGSGGTFNLGDVKPPGEKIATTGGDTARFTPDRPPQDSPARHEQPSTVDTTGTPSTVDTMGTPATVHGSANAEPVVTPPAPERTGSTQPHETRTSSPVQHDVTPPPSRVTKDDARNGGWERTQQDIANGYDAKFAEKARVQHTMDQIRPELDRGFTEWTSQRLADGSIRKLADTFGIPQSHLTQEHLAEVHDHAMKSVTDAVTRFAGTTPEGVLDGLTGELDRQALRVASQVAADHLVDRYFDNMQRPLIGGGDAVPAVMSPEAVSVVKETVGNSVRSYVDEKLDPVLAPENRRDIESRTADALGLLKDMAAGLPTKVDLETARLAAEDEAAHTFAATAAEHLGEAPKPPTENTDPVTRLIGEFREHAVNHLKLSYISAVGNVFHNMYGHLDPYATAPEKGTPEADWTNQTAELSSQLPGQLREVAAWDKPLTDRWDRLSTVTGQWKQRAKPDSAELFSRFELAGKQPGAAALNAVQHGFFSLLGEGFRGVYPDGPGTEPDPVKAAEWDSKVAQAIEMLPHMIGWETAREVAKQEADVRFDEYLSGRGLVPLGQEAVDRVKAGYRDRVDSAFSEHFKVGGSGDSTGYGEHVDRLTGGLDEHLAFESDAAEGLSHAGTMFDGIADQHTTDGAIRDELAPGFREDWFHAFHETWAPKDGDAYDWLRHEGAHENTFQPVRQRTESRDLTGVTDLVRHQDPATESRPTPPREQVSVIGSTEPVHQPVHQAETAVTNRPSTVSQQETTPHREVPVEHLIDVRRNGGPVSQPSPRTADGLPEPRTPSLDSATPEPGRPAPVRESVLATRDRQPRLEEQTPAPTAPSGVIQFDDGNVLPAAMPATPGRDRPSFKLPDRIAEHIATQLDLPEAARNKLVSELRNHPEQFVGEGHRLRYTRGDGGESELTVQARNYGDWSRYSAEPKLRPESNTVASTVAERALTVKRQVDDKIHYIDNVHFSVTDVTAGRSVPGVNFTVHNGLHWHVSKEATTPLDPHGLPQDIAFTKDRRIGDVEVEGVSAPLPGTAELARSVFPDLTPKDAAYQALHDFLAHGLTEHMPEMLKGWTDVPGANPPGVRIRAIPENGRLVHTSQQPPVRPPQPTTSHGLGSVANSVFKNLSKAGGALMRDDSGWYGVYDTRVRLEIQRLDGQHQPQGPSGQRTYQTAAPVTTRLRMGKGAADRVAAARQEPEPVTSHPEHVAVTSSDTTDPLDAGPVTSGGSGPTRLVPVGSVEVVVREVSAGGRRQLVLVSDAEWADVAGRPLVPPGEGVALVVHAAAGGSVRVPVQRRDGTRGEAEISVVELAGLMAALAPDAVSWVLAACAGGAVDGGFAQRLADLVDRAVLAPVGSVFVGADVPGHLSSWQGESWRLSVPGGTGGEGWDVVNDQESGGRPFDGVVAVHDESRSGLEMWGLEWVPRHQRPNQPFRDTNNQVHNMRDLRYRRLVGNRDGTTGLVFVTDDFADELFWSMRRFSGPPRFTLRTPTGRDVAVPSPWGDGEVFVVSVHGNESEVGLELEARAPGQTHLSTLDIGVNGRNLAHLMLADGTFDAAYRRGVRAILLESCSAGGAVAAELQRELSHQGYRGVTVYGVTRTVGVDSMSETLVLASGGHWTAHWTGDVGNMPPAYRQMLIAELAHTAAHENWGYQPQPATSGLIPASDRYRTHRLVREAIRESFTPATQTLNLASLAWYARDHENPEIIQRAAVARLLHDPATREQIRYLIELQIHDSEPLDAALTAELAETFFVRTGPPQRDQDMLSIRVPVEVRSRAEHNIAFDLPATSSPITPDPTPPQRTVSLIDNRPTSDPDFGRTLEFYRMARWLAHQISIDKSPRLRITGTSESFLNNKTNATYRAEAARTLLVAEVKRYLQSHFGHDEPTAEIGARELAEHIEIAADSSPLARKHRGASIMIVEETEPGPSQGQPAPPTGGRVEQVARDGWCIVNSFLTAAPDTVRARFTYDRPVRTWLNQLPGRLTAGGLSPDDQRRADIGRQWVRGLVREIRSDLNIAPSVSEYTWRPRLEAAIRNTRRAQFDPAGPSSYRATGTDIAEFLTAIENWGDEWSGEFGDGFMYFLVEVLGVPIRIRTPDYPGGYIVLNPTTWEHPNREVSLWRPDVAHYDAWIDNPPAQSGRTNQTAGP